MSSLICSHEWRRITQTAVKYDRHATYEKHQAIEHDRFGKGRVEYVEGNGVTVRFLDGSVRKLAHGLTRPQGAP